MFELVVEGAVARLALARPAARNAIPADQWSVLADTAQAAVAAGARLLFVEGRENAFCAGADLSDFAGFRNDAAARSRFRLAMRRALDGIAALPIPTVALIDGACFGAGVALAMACDLRVATDPARFGITPAKLGISYPQEDVHRLVGLVGPGQARRLLLTGETIGGAEALRIGLVELLAPDGLAATAAELAEALIANSVASLRALKTAVGLAAGGSASDEEQDRIFDELLGGSDLSERLAWLRPAPVRR